MALFGTDLGARLFASDPPPVNDLAVALSPTIGWLLLACAVVVVLLGIAQSDRWRRLWLRTEDPRAIGLFRILFALFVLLNVGGLYEHFTFLFTDEGIFTTDAARELLARDQFAGYGDGVGEPAGFFDWSAVVQFLKGPKYSLLFFWDSPTAFYLHLAGFFAVTIAFLVGWQTRLMGVLAWLGMHSITLRNPLYMEGTDLVYNCFFFYLLLARSGHAYSVDNWLRCRRLAREHKLSLPGGPGDGAGAPPSPEHPTGLAAIYRRIPAWPRLLMILQLATVYVYTGCAKTGGIWSRGDSLYYALNMDHFYRVPPQYLSAIFGTNVFRLMTWVVHVWQCTFPLVVVGLIVRWAIRERLPQYTGARLWLVRGLWLSLGLLALAVAEVAWPVHYAPNPALTLAQTQWLFGACWVAGLALIGWLWHRLRDRPFHVRLHGTTYRLDLEWFCGWFFGRRVFLTIGLIFHGTLLVLMNIGMFAPIMMLTYMVCLSGPELASILRGLGRALANAGVPWIPADVRAGRSPIPTEDPTLPHLHRDAAAVPTWALLSGLALGTASVALTATHLPGALTCLGLGLLALVAGGVASARKHGKRTLAADGKDGCPPDRPWAYGPTGRFLVNALVVYHIAAVTMWCLPDKQCLSTFRGATHKPFVLWLTRTHTAQGWNMFAPNPPRQNVFLKVVVTDTNGVEHDMRTDMYDPERKPVPWILNDRIFKMNRRMSGGESGGGDWYQKWHARYFCRSWALEHGGALPDTVELRKIWYRIPGPDEVARGGYYLPEVQLERFGKESHLYTARCATDPEAQPSDEILARHGLPAAGYFKPWAKNRHKKWEQQQKPQQKPQPQKEAAK